MKKQQMSFIFLFFVCLLMPSVVMADFFLELSRPDRPFAITSLESITFTVEVSEDGSPASGQIVTFSVSPDDGIASLSTTSATTDSSGQAQTTLSLSGDSSESYYKVKAKLDNGEGNVPIYWVPVGTVSDGAELTLGVDSLGRSYRAGESVRFTFRLRKDGTGVSGRTVTFSVSPDDGTASLSTTSATTDSGGAARTNLVLGSDASGSYRVTATLDDGKSVSNSIGSVYNPTDDPTLQPPDFILAMYVPSGSIPLKPGESRTFIAIAEKDGNYVSGKTVTFSVSPNDGTVSLSPTSATTDSNGEARTTLVTGSGSSGSYTVTASGGRRISISGTVTVEASSSSPPTDPNPDPPPEVIQIPQEQRAASEGSTGNTQAQQAAPEGSTDNTQAQQTAPEGPTGNTDVPEGSTGNTPAQQAAPAGPTGNTQGMPRSVTTNTPADTTGTPTLDTPEQQAPDLVVDALEVNKNVLDAGESFTISADVKNQSEGSSATATLTYYQYFDDKSIEKVGESAIASLAAGETTDVSITLTAPETSGTHSYYACVSTNCTSTVKISVGPEIKEVGSEIKELIFIRVIKEAVIIKRW